MRPGLRILVTCDAVGGVWQYSVDLCRSLADQGAEVCLAVLGPAPTPHQRRAVQGVAGVALVELGGELDWTASDPGQVAQAAAKIAALARRRGIDIVHLHSPAFAAATNFDARTVAVAHSCVGTWWEAVRGGALPADLAWRDELHAAGLRAVDLVITPSRSFAAATAGRHKLPQLPRTVYNGRSALPVRRGAMHDFAFTAGRLWDEGKNVATLDRAAARLGVPFKAAGARRSPHGEQIDLAHISALGQLDEAELARELGARPVFVTAARYEPFGLAVLEAAAAGCPLVLSDIPTFRELWGDVAWFVDPDDAEGFAAAIDALIGDSRDRIERGEAARACARRYSAAAMGRATMDAYHELSGKLAVAVPPEARAVA